MKAKKSSRTESVGNKSHVHRNSNTNHTRKYSLNIEDSKLS